MPSRRPAPGFAHHAPEVLDDGTVLRGGYEVAFLAAGGMSVAYRARRGSECFLVKEVPASETRNVMALTQEKATLERLDHPSIVKAIDLFEQDDHYYLVLEYVEGQDLEAFLQARNGEPLPERTLLDWGIRLCEILAYLHGQDPPVIYRDLKPQNVIRDPSGGLHLVDFGIARVFKETRVRDTHPMGSALFASPEHYGGAQTDPRSDVYTLGATLHYLARGGESTDVEAFTFPPLREANPLVSERLEAVIARAVSVEPASRFPDAAELREALVECLQTTSLPYGRDISGAPRASTLPARPETPPRGNPLGWLAAGLALGLVPLLLTWPRGGGSDAPTRPASMTGRSAPSPVATVSPPPVEAGLPTSTVERAPTPQTPPPVPRPTTPPTGSTASPPPAPPPSRDTPTITVVVPRSRRDPVSPAAAPSPAPAGGRTLPEAPGLEPARDPRFPADAPSPAPGASRPEGWPPPGHPPPRHFPPPPREGPPPRHPLPADAPDGASPPGDPLP